MHASISAHIAADYLLDESSGTWGPSLQQFERRLGAPATKSHLENLYFAYLFVLRAVMKAGPALQQADLSSGLSAEDVQTRALMDQLVSVACISLRSSIRSADPRASLRLKQLYLSCSTKKSLLISQHMRWIMANFCYDIHHGCMLPAMIQAAG